jgi:hypothetical protein
MSDRVRLPTRRQSITEVLYWPVPASAGGPLEALGRKVFLTAGFDPHSGRILEVFLRGGSKHGDRIDFALDDVAIAMSRELQTGAGLLDFFRVDGPIFRITDLLAPLEARAPDRRAAALMIEAVLHRLVQFECAHGADVRSVGAR